MIPHLSNNIFLLSSFVFSIFRSIITAGHCICDDMTGEAKNILPRCLLNFDENNPRNQIIAGRDIFYVVGQRIVNNGLFDISKVRTLLYNLPRAQQAFVYENAQYHWQTIQGKRKLKFSIDIGLILTTANIDPNIVECPIELPEKM